MIVTPTPEVKLEVPLESARIALALRGLHASRNKEHDDPEECERQRENEPAKQSSKDQECETNTRRDIAVIGRLKTFTIRALELHRIGEKKKRLESLALSAPGRLAARVVLG